MCHLKSILLLFILFAFSCSPRYASQSEIFISDQKLETIFNNGACNFDQLLDKSVLWEEAYGIKFLLQKLGSDNQRDQVMAITYLANTKNLKFMDIISSYLDSPNEQVIQSARASLKIIRAKQRTAPISEELKRSKEIQKARTMTLLREPLTDRKTEDF